MRSNRRIVKRDSRGQRTDHVKKREERMMEKLYAKEGLDPPEIAKKLTRDVRTVRNHLGLVPKADRPTSATDVARALQMESSGHWLGLRKVAKALQKQLGVPLSQALGLPEVGTKLPLTLVAKGKDFTIRLAVEEDILFQALKEHLPGNGVWGLLDEWKMRAKTIAQRWRRLCDWVKEQPETKEKPWLTPEEFGSGTLGLTERFGQTIVQNAVEDLYFNRRVDDAFYRSCIEREYKIRPPTAGANRRVLDWSRGCVSYAIAACEDLQKLENLKHLHMALRDKMRDTPELKATVEAYREFDNLSKVLEKDLERIASLAVFPGDCELCRGAASAG